MESSFNRFFLSVTSAWWSSMLGVGVLVVAGVVGCCWFLVGVVVEGVGMVLEVVEWVVVAGVPVPGMLVAVVAEVGLVPGKADGVVVSGLEGVEEDGGRRVSFCACAWVELSRMGIAEGVRLAGPVALVEAAGWVV
jgi:hypothetical protein